MQTRSNATRAARRGGPWPVLCAAAALLLTTNARGQGGMGQALYQPGMKNGSATVKVVGQSLGDLKVGQTVELHEQTAEGLKLSARAKTGSDGRAAFAGLTADKTYVAIVPLDPTPLRSAPFAGPESGGLRLLLSTTAGGAVPGHAAAAPPGHPPTGPAASDGRSGAVQVSRDDKIPAGRVVVEVVKGKGESPVADVEVTLDPLGGEKQTARTASDGTATLELPAEVKRFKLAAGYSGLRYHSDTITPSADRGLRARVTVFDRVNKPAVLRVGVGSHLLAWVGEGRVGFRQVLGLVNASDQLYDPGPAGLALPLPEGVVAVEVPETDARMIKAVGNSSVKLVAPVPPGRLSLEYRYEMPYDDGVLDFRQRMPLQMSRTVLVFANSNRVQLTGPAFDSRREDEMNGNRVAIFTLRETKRGDRIEFIISGLPDRDQTALYATFSLSAVLLLWGVFSALRRSPADEARQRRERLTEELVALERAHQRGDEQDEQRYQNRRRELLEQLQAVWRGPAKS